MDHDPRPYPPPPPPYAPPAPPPAAYPVPQPFVNPPVPATAAATDAKAAPIAYALFGVAAITLIGLVTKSWFTAREGTIGLTGIDVRGHSIAWGDIPRLPGDIAIFAYLGLLSGLAAVAAAATMGGMLLAHKATRIPVKAINLVLGVAAFSTTMFLMRFYGENPKGISFGFSGFLAIGGIIAIGAITKQGVMPRARG
jgi:hypothetical protein